MMAPDAAAPLRHDGKARTLRGIGLAVSVAALPGIALWALNVGSTSIALDRLLAAVIDVHASRAHVILWEVRFPRVLAGLLVGAQLAVAGAIMQAVTANPLASPGLLGINAGATFAVVLAIAMAGIDGAGALMWFAFLGAGAAAVTVYGLGSAGGGGATPLRLALVGVVLTAFLASLTTVILLRHQTTLDNVRLWSIGSLSGRPMSAVLAIGPWGLAGLAGAVLTSGPIMTLSLGRDLARVLGQNLATWRAICAALVVVLAGAAVALAGPVGFVGLVVPHMARLLVGSDYRWIIAYSAPLGAALVVLADTVLRWLFGVDIPVGVTLALVGGPVFIALVRRQGWNLR